MDEQSRRRLGELAGELGDLLDVGSDSLCDGTGTSTEMQSLLHLADGFVGVLLHEVERERAAATGSGT
jgi:hypothetical protein